MSHDYRLIDLEFRQSRVQHLRLHLDRDVAVIRPLAVTVTWSIKSERLVL